MNKLIILSALVLFIIPNILYSAENIKPEFLGSAEYPVGNPIITTYTPSSSVEILIENNETITNASFGFRLSITGDMTIQINSAEIVPGSRAADGLVWNIAYDNEEPSDSILFIGVAVPASGFDGIVPGPHQSSMVINFDLPSPCNQSQSDEGTICIDSCSFIPPAGNWMWDYTTPSFNSESGPECIDIVFMPCGVNYFVTVPENGEIIGNHCDGVQFQFEAVPPFPEEYIAGYNMCPNAPAGASVDNSGFFSFEPNDIGTYDMTIYAYGSCVNPGFYSFSVILTNDGVGYTYCPTIPLFKLAGNSVTYDFGMTSLDCDPIVLETVSLVSSPGSDPINAPSMTDGILSWLPDESELGTWVFEVYAEDEYGAGGGCEIEIIVTDDISSCGDANADSDVNVSDAVYIINFVFVGGPEPPNWEWANVNCDWSVNVSDAVWIINYVFVAGSPAPCECE